MEGDELREAIMNFAKKQIEPFTTADVFKAVDEAEALDEVSNSLRKLFISGHLARKKIDNVRYAYSIPTNAPHDFSVDEESILKRAEEIGDKLFGSDEEKQEKAIKVRSAKPANSKEIPGALESIELEGTDLKGYSQDLVQQLPEEFTLTLQTPGGLKIVITNGRVSA